MCKFVTNRLILIVYAMLVIAVVSPALFADEEKDHPATPPTTQRSSGGQGGQRQRGVNLEHEMETIGRAFKTLQKQIADSSKNASSIELIQQIQTATVAAKSVLPGRLKRMPDAERTEQTRDYRTMMLSLLRLETDVEEHLIDNNNVKAAEAVQQMEDLQKKAHDEFKVKVHD